MQTKPNEPKLETSEDLNQTLTELIALGGVKPFRIASEENAPVRYRIRRTLRTRNNPN